MKWPLAGTNGNGIGTAADGHMTPQRGKQIMNLEIATKHELPAGYRIVKQTTDPYAWLRWELGVGETVVTAGPWSPSPRKIAADAWKHAAAQT